MSRTEEDKDFWNRHSLAFLEMAYEAGYRERIENPDGYGERTGECGDRVMFFILVNQGELAHISFDVQGCLNTTACCNTVIRLAKGLPLEKAWEITPDDVAAYLKTLPQDHYHCAELALGGFYRALRDYERRTAKDSRP